MGVDGIGSGGPPVPGVGGGELSGAHGVESSGAPGTESTSGPERSTGSVLLDQLQRGEIDVEGYLDAQVNAAVSHVQGSLAPAQLDLIREVLREQIAADPVLSELVRRATGSTPAPRIG